MHTSKYIVGLIIVGRGSGQKEITSPHFSHMGVHYAHAQRDSWQLSRVIFQGIGRRAANRLSMDIAPMTYSQDNHIVVHESVNNAAIADSKPAKTCKLALEDWIRIRPL